MSLWPGIRPRVRSALHVIPKITDRRGWHWTQPGRAQITMDDETAYMTQATWNRLADYSRSNPTGVYDGKMWKAIARDGTSSLRWYAPGSTPNTCAIHSRRVEIV